MRTGRALRLIVTLTLGILAAPVTAGAQPAAKVARVVQAYAAKGEAA